MKQRLAAARERARALLNSLSLAEKIGQMVQFSGERDRLSADLAAEIRAGRVGAVLNVVEPAAIEEIQRVARDESPHGIPLLIGRDVVHGFSIVGPIPLGQAATFDEDLVRAGARVAAAEAAETGINWTFAPMLDVCRDPRWGRIAECFGEDVLLTSRMGAAMVRGFQEDPATPLLSCPKHFAGYGASESGRDYNRTYIPEIELRNVYLPPFMAALEAGALSLMPSFSDLNGVPATANRWLLRNVLRQEWNFQGFVVSDWAAIAQLIDHGVAGNLTEATALALAAGINMDMSSHAYCEHISGLLERGQIDVAVIDGLVEEILAVKYALGLFEPVRSTRKQHDTINESIRVARALALQSVVLLKNECNVLPIDFAEAGKVALLGPLADQPYEQLGTWVFDADADMSVSVRQALCDRLGKRLLYAPVLANSRDQNTDGFDAARALVAESEFAIVVLGEESILSGEAHCRADITLPGAQQQLLEAISRIGTPVVVIIMAGRPLLLQNVLPFADALLFSFHPGSMGGPALAELLAGDSSPSGRLPVSFPRVVGQIPIYYDQGNTGRPATASTMMAIDEIPPQAPQYSTGNTSYHLDQPPSPQFAFGFGLTYTRFVYENLRIIRSFLPGSTSLEVAVDLLNAGDRSGIEVVQLYIRDLVASVTRPVKQLKDWRRVALAAGSRTTVRFVVERETLAFYNGVDWVVEPGEFEIWIGPDSQTTLSVITELPA
ncbi:MAG: glycoside hydrolase family 3 N-terminal domain-containing protein [Pseudomonadota bacterium]